MLYDEIIRPLRHVHKKDAFEALARQHGVLILRLPPYHCILNPIELLWAKVKGDLRKQNRIENKLFEVVNICRDVFSEITVNFCSSVCRHAEAEEAQFFTKDGIIVPAVLPLTVPFDDPSCFDENSYEEEY
uniref:Tc1-like transposase DDE domain-containing protein n=1 Tax=Plectus sambesii TaxID=2011161 RepID=A0A914WU40_9BILA